MRSLHGWGESISRETFTLTRWNHACFWKPAWKEPQRHQEVINSSCWQLWKRKNTGADLCNIWTFSAYICALFLLTQHPFPRDRCWHCRVHVYTCMSQSCHPFPDGTFYLTNSCTRVFHCIQNHRDPGLILSLVSGHLWSKVSFW